MITKATMATQNLDMIQQAIEEADKKLQGQPLSTCDFRAIRDEYEAKLESSRADMYWLHENIRRLVATITALEDKISELNSEILAKNRVIYQAKKALE